MVMSFPLPYVTVYVTWGPSLVGCRPLDPGVVAQPLPGGQRPLGIGRIQRPADVDLRGGTDDVGPGRVGIGTVPRRGHPSVRVDDETGAMPGHFEGASRVRYQKVAVGQPDAPSSADFQLDHGGPDQGRRLLGRAHLRAAVVGARDARRFEQQHDRTCGQQCRPPTHGFPLAYQAALDDSALWSADVEDEVPTSWVIGQLAVGQPPVKNGRPQYCGRHGCYARTEGRRLGRRLLGYHRRVHLRAPRADAAMGALGRDRQGDQREAPQHQILGQGRRAVRNPARHDGLRRGRALRPTSS